MGSSAMKFLRRWLMSAIPIIASVGSHASAQDYLEPERGSVNDSQASLDYYLRLHKALLKDAAFHYRARVICEPAFRPRWVVSLVCDAGHLVGDGKNHSAFFIEYRTLVAGADGSFETARVQKATAPVDQEAAEAIQGLWLRMLRAVRHPDDPRTGADGVTYHFSRFIPLGLDDPLAPGGWEAGQIWTPDPNSTNGRLASISEVMRDFAMAPQEKRAGLRERILKQAIALKSEFDRRPKPAEKMP
jgi:hypothetical protein